MTPQNAAPLVAEGATLVAAITSVYMADDVAAAVREFQSIICPLAHP
jgi:thiamine-phosphate pyrophosphorylase